MTEENKCKCTCEECGDECNPYYKRLKQENKELKEETLQWKQIKDMANNNKYRNALEEIKEKIIICQDTFHTDIVDKINEVLQ